jgi:hypothetical protein
MQNVSIQKASELPLAVKSAVEQLLAGCGKTGSDLLGECFKLFLELGSH